MPELPEVETIKRQLKKEILGKQIKSVDVLLPKMINLSPKDFRKKLDGAVITDIQRKAKNMIIKLAASTVGDSSPARPFGGSYRLQAGLYLLVHLKMTGQLIYIEAHSRGLTPLEGVRPRIRHSHLIFHFSDQSKLLYNDMRRFGYIKLLTKKELNEYFEKQKFGPEPLDKNFSLQTFKALLRKKRRGKIKQVLMDQTVISGIGNLYAAEICFYSEISPLRNVSALTEKEIKNLYAGIRKILAQAIKHKGSSVDNYVDAYGKEGDYVPLIKVYGREGKKCLRCGTVIKTIKLGGRGTYFCPNCQR
ncbi:DNA-formamidopyrimidine glycosylase [Candidatus Falkowbacteria bacterium RBG_13_39_14]|uniref:Formamidopyrimidine-DNA glycosylase n=1 Tax=Candidatus Falkowbacteria bacterium RBG_13_39_14 TaxID=1797985 RepID=A0A1F5S8U8_9BACT|nr:MAG: DNA-formamidopyrimidine glycosylase [Candidatus Falkowbacteria bacterium RBG_13_39_14]